jgi:DNA mismatch endonuclease, patch repair protein
MSNVWRQPPKRGYVARDPKITSRMMSAVKNKDSRAEMVLRRALWRRGLRYLTHVGELPGRPDLVFRGPKVAVFVDGDFWHGRALREQGVEAFAATLRTERKDWWVAKIRRTVERDNDVTRQLEEAGWRVVRLWESAVLRDLDAAVAGVLAYVSPRPRS